MMLLLNDDDDDDDNDEFNFDNLFVSHLDNILGYTDGREKRDGMGNKEKKNEEIDDAARKSTDRESAESDSRTSRSTTAAARSFIVSIIVNLSS